MLARKIAETFLFAFVSALIIPVLTFWLSGQIAIALEDAYAVPAIITVLIASLLLPFVIKAVVSLFLTINMAHIAVALAIFVIQIPICWVFFLLGAPGFLMVSVLAGSLISVIITVIFRPFTLAYEVGKGATKKIRGDSGKKKK